MDIKETLNELLVNLFRSINTIEEQAMRTEEYKDVTTNDMHVIEAIGTGAPKNMTTVARILSVTTGTLTISANSLVKKGYVQRVRSEEDNASSCVKYRHFPGGRSPSSRAPSRTRRSRFTVRPHWAHIRRTCRFFPS